MAKAVPLVLSIEEHNRLESIVRTRTLQAQVVSRARILLLKESGDSVDAIAEKALQRGTGARGLRSIMEKTMMDVMYDIPSDETIVSCVITKDSVEGTAPPKLTHGEKPPLPEKRTSQKRDNTDKPRHKRKAVRA